MGNKNIKILAIDDNRDNLISLKALLSEALPQSVVYMELSGQGGIESAKKNDPDVILLDIVMPGMDGYQVCKILKSEEHLSETPIIFLTALKGDKQSRILALEAGGEAFLAKPIDATELKAQILAMLKIKEAATYKRDQRLQLEELVQKRTEELKSANIAALNLLEDLIAENEIRKQSEEALRESERQFAFLAGTAFDLIKLTSIQNIYEYTARKLHELMEDKGIVAIVEYYADSNRWKIQLIEGIQNQLDELAKIFGFDIRKLDGEISSKYYDKIISGKLQEVEFDFPGLFNNKVSDLIGKAVKKLLSIDKIYCIAFQESEKIFGNITLATKMNAKPLNAELIEAFALQVTNFIKKQKSEEALRQNEEKLQSIFRIAPAGIGVVNNRVLTELNNRVCEMTGYSSEELIGQCSRILYSSQAEFEFAGQEKYAQIAKVGTGMVETRWQRKDGKVRDILLASTPIDPQDLSQGVIFTALDISERKQAEEKLKLLNRAIEASSVSVVITDAEGNINYVNPFFTELTGYSYEEVLGKNPRFLKSGHHPKTFYEGLWNTILSGREWTGEFHNKKKNGELYWEKAVISPILNTKGEVTNFVAIKEDITEKKKNLEELVLAKEKAQESDKLKTAFISNISHEIRTPLNGILGFGQFLIESDLSEKERRDYFELVEKSGDRLMNTVTDYMDMAMLVSNAMVVSKKDFALETVFAKITEKSKKLCADKNLDFKLEISKEALGLTVNSDPESIQKILDKLIENAIKFTNEGSIICGCQIKSEHLLFFVKDTGCGIDNKKLDFIFEIFRQADTTITRNYEGSGLGLTIAKGLVTLLGGVIDVASENEKGSVFSFTLPYNTLS